MATSVRSATGSLQQAPMDILNAIRTFGFLVTVTLIQWYIFINPPAEGFNRDVAQIYMQMGVAFLLITFVMTSYAKMQFKGLKTVNIVFYGVTGFGVSWAVSLFLFTQIFPTTFGTVQVSAIWGILVTQVLFVATTEEMVFRWLLPTYLRNVFSRRYRWLAFLLPQISFAAFHTSVYQGDWNALLMAFAFGCVMMLAFEYIPPIGKKGEREKLGLGFTIGCHAAFNLLLLGVLAPHGITTLLGG